MHDRDADGVLDKDDNCLDIPNPTQDDFDHDKFGNECDIDDDNDGVDDAIDFFDMEPQEWADFDFDGIGSNADTDDDNDGLEDIDDAQHSPVSETLTSKHLKEIEDCALLHDTPKLLCYSNFFNILVKQEENNSDALELALSLSKIGSLDDCHFVSHEIGHAAFEENPDITTNLQNVDSSFCRGGYYHGVIAAYFHKLKEENRSLPNFSAICEKLNGTIDYISCLHGLGHGIVHYYPADIKKSVQACNEMSFYPATQCLTGAFMQYADNKLTVSKNIESDINEICPKTLQEHDYVLCVMQTGTSISFHTDHDQKSGEKLCRLLEDESDVENCMVGLVTEIDTAKKELVTPTTRMDRPILETFSIMDGAKQSISIISKDRISGFNYMETKQILEFTKNSDGILLMFGHRDLLNDSIIVKLNGKAIDWEKKPLRNKDFTAISVYADEPGKITIANLG